MTIDDASKIRGANYLCAGAADAHAMWQQYDRATIERDLDRAAKLKLNTLRVMLSYDYWLAHKGLLENSIYHLAQTAWASHKIRILPVLFECRPPYSQQFEDPTKWFAIEDFVNWFMQRWAHEHRLVALEVIDEPKSVVEFKFARTMFARAARMRKSLPLTFGARKLEDSRLIQDLGLDLLQVHLDASCDEQTVRQSRDEAAATQDILGRPVLVVGLKNVPPALDSHRLGIILHSLPQS
jgi:hypothetical protein